ncbi:MAG: energy transducer TonB, partial [Brevundimonas sp.]
MTDTPVEYHRSRYDAPRKKGFMGVSIGVWLLSLLVVSILFAILLFYLQSAKFKLRVMDYTDDAV